MRTYVVRVGYREFHFDNVVEAAHFINVGASHIEDGESLEIKAHDIEDASEEKSEEESEEDEEDGR